MTAEELQKRTDEVNAMLAARDYQRAADLAVTLRNEVRARVASHPDLLQALQSVESAVNSLEASGYRGRARSMQLQFPVLQAMLHGPKSIGSRGFLVTVAAITLLSFGSYRLTRLYYHEQRLAMDRIRKQELAEYTAHEKKLYAEYTAGARPVIEQLERLEAETDTGITYQTYMEKLGDANFYFERFLAAYKRGWARYLSANCIMDAIADYTSVPVFWKIQINDTDDPELAGMTEKNIQANWASASKSLSEARALIREGK